MYIVILSYLYLSGSFFIYLKTTQILFELFDCYIKLHFLCKEKGSFYVIPMYNNKGNMLLCILKVGKQIFFFFFIAFSSLFVLLILNIIQFQATFPICIGSFYMNRNSLIWIQFFSSLSLKETSRIITIRYINNKYMWTAFVQMKKQ